MINFSDHSSKCMIMLLAYKFSNYRYDNLRRTKIIMYNPAKIKLKIRSDLLTLKL